MKLKIIVVILAILFVGSVFMLYVNNNTTKISKYNDRHNYYGEVDMFDKMPINQR